MKEQQDPKVRQRRLYVRTVLVAVYLGLIALVFVMGKGHTVLIDNKDSPDGTLKAMDGVMVSVDRLEALELYPGDRDKADVKGQRHRVTVESLDGSTKIAKNFTLPLGKEMFILSVPKVVAGVEPFVDLFMPKDMPVPSNESVGNTNSFTSPDAVPTPGADAPPAVPPAL